jgi:DNA-binding CsgD family transcriptional regulator
VAADSALRGVRLQANSRTDRFGISTRPLGLTFPVVGNWPLTGRDEELDLLTALLDGAVFKGVVLAGGAGVGKTRLAREASEVAAEQGWVVRSVHGTAAAQAIPLGAFSQWIDQSEGQPLTLVSSVIAGITAAPKNSPVLVVVDDVHLLDDLSAFVLDQLVRRGAATVIATLRTGEAVSKPVTELWKDGHLKRLDLRPLSRRKCKELLEGALGSPISDPTSERLWELTRGNVLFLHALVRQERQAERLIHTDGEWTWTGPITVSHTLAELVDVYIGTAPGPVLEVLDLLVVAEPLELAHLSTLADPQVIEDAERHELIQLSHGPATDFVRIGHPLYGETQRSRMGLMRARRLRARVAEVMRASDSGAAPADPVRLALLWLDSDLSGDPEVHLHGAAAAFRRLDTGLSERLAEAAIRAGAGAEAHVLHARTLSMRGSGEQAEQVLSLLLTDEERDDTWVAATTLRAMNLLLTLGRPEESRVVIEEALSDASAPMDQEFLAFRAVQLAMAARPAEVVDLLESIDQARLTSASRINLNFGTTIALGELGRIEQATQTPEDDFVLAADSPANAFQAVSLALMHVDALAVNGYIAEAMSLSERVVGQWTDVPDVSRSIAEGIIGVAAAAYGDLPSARERLSCALTTKQPRRGKGSLPFLGIGSWMRIAYVETLARAGDVESAVPALRDMQRNRHPSFMFLEPNRMLAAAWLAAAQGHTTKALNLVSEATDFARKHGQHSREVLCLQTAIQFGDNANHTGRLDELAALVEGPRAPLVARWAEARAANDGDPLLSVSADLEAMGDRIGAADAAAHAAEAFDAHNLRGSRLTASARATQLIAACGATTLATRETASPLPLSKREREIANLVRDGLSNKEIADSLTMSVRTVEGHIYRACNKLGFASRAELAELISQLTP